MPLIKRQTTDHQLGDTNDCWEIVRQDEHGDDVLAVAQTEFLIDKIYDMLGGNDPENEDQLWVVHFGDGELSEPDTLPNARETQDMCGGEIVRYNQH